MVAFTRRGLVTIGARAAGLDAMLAPASIAVVGASSQSTAFSRRALGYLRQFAYPGRVWAVNPSLTDVEGTPCYPSLREIPDAVDLALVFTAAARVEEMMHHAVEAGVKAAAIFSSGFAEMGAAGRALQQRVLDIAAPAGIRLLGPNCQGLINARLRMAATFTSAAAGLDQAPVGPVAYVGQSGAVGGALFDLMRARGLAPAVWVSTGNQIDVTVTEVARHLVGDPGIETILVYLEQTPPGADWRDLCVAAQEAGKLIVALHTGRTPAGQRAAASHTGALVGENRSFELLSHTHGVVLVDDLRPMIDLALARRGRAHLGGRRLGIVTTSGGAGGLAADGCAAHGLAVATLTDETRGLLVAMLPTFASSANPVDVTAQFVLETIERTGELCQIVARDPGVDHTLIVLTNLAGAVAVAFANSVIAALPEMATPVGLVFLAAADRTTEARTLLSAAGVATYEMITNALRAIDALAPAKAAMTEVPGETAIRDRDRDRGEGDSMHVLTEAEGTALLDGAGVPRPASTLVRSGQEAEQVATKMRGPFVLKVQSPQVIHKSDVGGVRVGVHVGDLAAAYDELIGAVTRSMPTATIDGVLVQELVAPGLELLVGITGGRDGYAPVVVVGRGGTEAELHRDTASAVAPIDAEAAATMLRSLRSWPLLNGYRGRPGLDVEAASEAISALSRLAVDIGDALVDLEVNPLIVHEQGIHAADFVARLRSES